MSKKHTAFGPVKVNQITPALEKELRTAFVFGRILDDDSTDRDFPSLRDLEREYNVNHNTLQLKAKKGGWVQAKVDNDMKCEAEYAKERQRLQAKVDARTDAAIVKGVNKSITEAFKRVEKAGGIVPANGEGFTAKELATLSQAITNLQKASKLARGEAGEITKVETLNDSETDDLVHDIRISAAVGKAAVDKETAEAEEAASGDGGPVPDSGSETAEVVAEDGQDEAAAS